jgi:hypothetical protein
MTQAESRALKHTIPLKPSLIPLKRPCVPPHPLDLETSPGQSFYKKWGGVAKNLGLNFGAVKFNG